MPIGGRGRIGMPIGIIPGIMPGRMPGPIMPMGGMPRGAVGIIGRGGMGRAARIIPGPDGISPAAPAKSVLGFCGTPPGAFFAASSRSVRC